MAIKEITYDNKVDLELWGNVPDVNKIKADDMNEIKNTVNNNAKELISNEDNQIHIETEQSSTINVQDCSNLSAKIDIFGVSEQETRSGKNKFNIDDFKDVGFILNGTGEITDDYINVIATEENITYTNNALQNVDSILPEQYRKYCSELVEGENVFSFKFENKSTNKLASVYYNLLDENYKAINQIYRLADDTNVSGKLSATINNSNAKYLYPRFDACIGGNVVYSEIMVAQDLAEYEKYGASPSPEFPSEIENVVGDIDITVCNKNLFDKNKSKINYILTATGTEIVSEGAFISDYIFVKKGITYFSNTRGYSNAGFYDLDKQFIERKDLPQNSQFIPDNNYYIRLNGKIENIETLQFEIDNKSTEYTRHQSQKIIFPLSEGQRLMKGDYLADDGIHHKEKQIELDGTENWFIGSITSLRYSIRLELQDIKLKTTNLITEILSNCFLPDGSSENSTGYENKFTFRQANGSRNLWFFIPKNFFTTTTSTKILEEWKAYLSAQKIAGTPVTIEYPLAEEEIEAYTEEQQEADNQLQNAKTYKLVTNVFTDNAEIQMDYVADTKTYVDNEINSIKEQLNTINELLSTANTSAMLLDNLQTDLESEVL